MSSVTYTPPTLRFVEHAAIDNVRLTFYKHSDSSQLYAETVPVADPRVSKGDGDLYTVQLTGTLSPASTPSLPLGVDLHVDVVGIAGDSESLPQSSDVQQFAYTVDQPTSVLFG